MAALFHIFRGLILGFILGVTFPSPAPAAEIHVPVDYPTIQQALDAASSGDVILVAPDTYAGPLNNNLDFRGKAIELRSTGSPALTIIHGQVGGRILRFHSGETAAAIVDGFTITQGLPNLFENNSSPTIRNCIFSFHTLNAIRCDNSSPVISHCTFVDNSYASSTTGAGIRCINNSSLRVDSCFFARNNASAGEYGGGIYAESSSLVVTECVFRDNGGEGGGGISSLFSELTISDSDFQGNSSDNNGGGGIYCAISVATITDCRFYDNMQCGHGAGLATLSSEVTVTNCSFAANGSCSQIHAGGLSGSMTLENTIIAWGAGPAVSCDGGTVVTLRCCDVFGNQGGDWADCIAGQQGVEGNFAADPQFCNLADGNFTLNGGSPCLPGNHPQGEDCGLIGAFDQGCGATAVEPTTWGAIKAGFGR